MRRTDDGNVGVGTDRQYGRLVSHQQLRPVLAVTDQSPCKLLAVEVALQRGPIQDLLRLGSV